MADEIKKDSAAAPEKKSKKENKPEAPKKKKNVFASMGKNIKKFFKDLRGECKKVVWPDSKTVFKSTGIVLLCVFVLGLVIWGIDTGLSELIKLLVNASKNAPADAETTTAVAGSIISGFFGL